MSQDKSHLLWTGLIAVTLMTPIARLHADDASKSADGYRIVPVTVGGHTLPIKVQDSNPFKNVSHNTSGPYDPRSINFSAESPMANKKFDAPGGSTAQDSSSYQHQNFVTKGYENSSALTPPNIHTKADITSNAKYNKDASDLNKSFTTTQADLGPNQTSLLAKADTEDQNRAALVNAKSVEVSESSMGNKSFEGPEADAVHKRLTKTDDGRIFISDLPNRSLTIDEVRNLLNHGVKADTQAKPQIPSKPLNDPEYKPEPLRETPPVTDDDKNDAVPPPGTMSTPPLPENSEPLPQP